RHACAILKYLLLIRVPADFPATSSRRRIVPLPSSAIFHVTRTTFLFSTSSKLARSLGKTPGAVAAPNWSASSDVIACQPSRVNDTGSNPRPLTSEQRKVKSPPCPAPKLVPQ